MVDRFRLFAATLALSVLPSGALGADVPLAATSARIVRGAVQVSGRGAAPNAALTWDGQSVGQATARGTFAFRTTALPQDCVGLLSDGVEGIDVVVQGCGPAGPPGPADYSVVSSAPQTSNPPGGTTVSASCPTGTRALGGGFVQAPASINTYNYLNAPLSDGSGWQAGIYHNVGDAFLVQLTAWAICANVD
jgi:hypothetical protein